MRLKMTYKEYQECLQEADRQMKAKNGHTYVVMLKTRCVHCGRSPRGGAKFRCRGWFQTFVDILSRILQERGFIEPTHFVAPKNTTVENGFAG